MSAHSFSVHVSYASVDQKDGGDPRAAARELLSGLRVVAAVRNATAPWYEGQDAVVEIAVTEHAKVLTLSAQDTIETDLAVPELRDAFADAGMTLWMSADGDDLDERDADADNTDADDAADAGGESEGVLGESAQREDDADDVDLSGMVDVQPVRVAAFSHRGPMLARFLAESTGSSVDYVEAGTWSLCRYATTEPTDSLPPTRAEGPVIELNIAQGSEEWVEVRTPGLATAAVPFWPQGERDTQPVLDLETIAVPETKEIYRRLIVEGDGNRDTLDEIAAVVPVDADAAHRALAPESLGGVVGADTRTRAFLAAFQVPAALIDLALAEASAADSEGLTGHRRMEPQGWARTIGDALIGGYSEALPLTRRDRWDARVSRVLRANLLLARTLSAGELILGVVAAKRLRGGWKSLGILLVLDAAADLVLAAVRRRRR